MTHDPLERGRLAAFHRLSELLHSCQLCGALPARGRPVDVYDDGEGGLSRMSLCLGCLATRRANGESWRRSVLVAA